jgi:hypothetical protein
MRVARLDVRIDQPLILENSRTFLMSKKTLSEQLFEDFCIAHQLDWERLSPSSQKGEPMPNYAIRIENTTIEVEIKEIESREGLRQRCKSPRPTDLAVNFTYG